MIFLDSDPAKKILFSFMVQLIIVIRSSAFYAWLNLYINVVMLLFSLTLTKIRFDRSFDNICSMKSRKTDEVKCPLAYVSHFLMCLESCKGLSACYLVLYAKRSNLGGCKKLSLLINGKSFCSFISFALLPFALLYKCNWTASKLIAKASMTAEVLCRLAAPVGQRGANIGNAAVGH